MFKTRFALLAVLAFGLFAASPSQANDEFATANASVSSETNSANSEVNASSAESAQYPYSCVATTQCFNPYTGYWYPISCATYGYGCGAWFVPNFSVQCQGLDPWGRWVNVYYRCY